MAKYRIVYTSFWNDTKVMEDMTPEDKFFFLYLLTNSHATQIGVYQITKKIAGFEMGYSPESIAALFERFINHLKLINYNADTREVAIKNWGKYNLFNGGKPVLDCVNKELSEVKDCSLLSYVAQNVPNARIRSLYEKFYDTSTIRGTARGQKEKEKEKEEGESNHLENPHTFYEKNFSIPSAFVIDSITEWCGKMGDDVVLEAMKISSKNGISIFSYVEQTLIDWSKKNINDLEGVQAYQQQRKGKKLTNKQKKSTGAKSVIDELRGESKNDS